MKGYIKVVFVLVLPISCSVETKEATKAKKPHDCSDCSETFDLYLRDGSYSVRVVEWAWNDGHDDGAGSWNEHFVGTAVLKDNTLSFEQDGSSDSGFVFKIISRSNSWEVDSQRDEGACVRPVSQILNWYFQFFSMIENKAYACQCQSDRGESAILQIVSEPVPEFIGQADKAQYSLTTSGRGGLDNRNPEGAVPASGFEINIGGTEADRLMIIGTFK